SRLFMNLREAKGYTYGAYASLSPDEIIGSFSADASVRTEVTDSAAYQFFYELNRMAEKTITEEELDAAKAYLTGSFGRSLESPATIASFALRSEEHTSEIQSREKLVCRLLLEKKDSS